MAQVSGLPFKLVYQDWITIDDINYPVPNGLHPLVIDKIKESSTHGYQNFRAIEFEQEFQRNNSGYYFRHSNLIGYFEFHYGIDNIVPLTEVNNENITYWFPIEIEWSGMEYLQNPSQFEYEGNFYHYSIEHVLNQNALELLRSGKLKLLISNFIDPASHTVYIVGLTRKFKNLGIDPKNIYFLFGNVPYEFVRIKEQLGSNVSKVILSLHQAGQTINSFPNKNNLGYENDNVKPTDLNYSLIRNKKFICFNRSMDRPHRIWLFHLVIKYNLLNDGIFSFLTRFDPDMTKLYLRQIEIDKDINKYIEEMINLIPYELDTHHLSMQEKENFQTVGINKKDFYLDSYIHIVSETSFNEDLDPFFSEKTWRPIMNMQPFIYVGNCGALKVMKQIGFKTFDKWFDESYDEVQEPKQRFRIIKKELIRLNNMSITEIHKMYYEMSDILIHNFELLKMFNNYNPLEEFFNGN